MNFSFGFVTANKLSYWNQLTVGSNPTWGVNPSSQVGKAADGKTRTR